MISLQEIITQLTMPKRARIPGHKVTMEWSGEYGEESSSTGTCTCGWEESCSSQREVRNEFGFHKRRMWARMRLGLFTKAELDLAFANQKRFDPGISIEIQRAHENFTWVGLIVSTTNWRRRRQCWRVVCVKTDPDEDLRIDRCSQDGTILGLEWGWMRIHKGELPEGWGVFKRVSGL